MIFIVSSALILQYTSTYNSFIYDVSKCTVVCSITIEVFQYTDIINTGYYNDCKSCSGRRYFTVKSRSKQYCIP